MEQAFAAIPHTLLLRRKTVQKHCNMCSGTGIIQRDKHVVLSMFVTAIHFHHVCCQKYNFVVDPSTCQHLLFLFTRFGLLILDGTGMGEFFKLMYKRKLRKQKIGCWCWRCHGNKDQRFNKFVPLNQRSAEAHRKTTSRYDYLLLKSFTGITFLTMYVYHKEMVTQFQIVVHCNFDHQQITLKTSATGLGASNIVEPDV